MRLALVGSWRRVLWCLRVGNVLAFFCGALTHCEKTVSLIVGAFVPILGRRSRASWTAVGDRREPPCPVGRYVLSCHGRSQWRFQPEFHPISFQVANAAAVVLLVANASCQTWIRRAPTRCPFAGRCLEHTIIFQVSVFSSNNIFLVCHSEPSQTNAAQDGQYLGGTKDLNDPLQPSPWPSPQLLAIVSHPLFILAPLILSNRDE
jgi:hypothetical protein